jgi:hypothetical protein
VLSVFDFDPDYDHDKYRKAKFSEANEDRDNPTFIAWNMLSEMGIDEAHAELNNICERVKAGDRDSMLELIEITANEFLVFDTLPLKLRASLSDGLKEVGNVLRLSRGKKGFLFPLPSPGRGRSSEEKNQIYQRSADLTALRIVHCAREHGLSIEEATGKVAIDFNMSSESLAEKHYKRNNAKHDARLIFKVIDRVYEICGIAVSPIRRKKKVR